jgi:uncharacterized delta-60 repeat protein
MEKIIMKNKFINSAFIFMAIGLTFLPSLAASPGSLDPSFGVAGIVKTNILNTDFLQDLAVQEDGKIVAVGSSSGVGDFVVVRYTANGVLDTTFGGDGIVFTDFTGALDGAVSVEVQKDGKIFVAGFAGSLQTGLVRYNANGSLDTSFDTDGKLVISDFEFAGSEIQTDGKIILVGNNAANDARTIRLNSNGSFDTTFNATGSIATNVEGIDRLKEVKTQPDGKIVAAGNSVSSGKSLVIRYNSNGTLDTTFSGDGIALNDFSVAGEPTRSMVINPITGSITTVGANFDGFDTSIVIRYLSNGNLDTSFSGDGRFDISFTTPAGAVTGGGGEDIVIQSDGKTVILSNVGAGTAVDDVHLTRLDESGNLDTTFGKGGFVYSDLNAGVIRSMVLVGDKLIVGNSANSATDFGLERYNLSATPTATADYDGDGTTDTAVFRPSTRDWFILRSTDNTFAIFQFGLNGDVPIDGDFDGDGKSDLAIFRPSSGVWFFLRSSDGTTLGAQFGQTGDKPIPGDYDKDGKTDIAFFRPSTANWFVLRSSTNFSAFFGFQFGATGDIPLSSEQK